MSFSAKFSFKKKDSGEEKDNLNGPKLPEAKKQKVKQHPLLNAKHGFYADDGELYTPKITKAERNEYWLAILNNRGKRALPSGFKSWMSKEIATEHESDNYPMFYNFLFNVCSSLNWDHRTLNLFFIFLLLIIALYDGWAAKYVPQLVSANSNDQLLVFLSLGMFICQLIPPLGLYYLTHYCNDLVRFRATMDFQNWAFGAALMAQYIEYFYYGGQNRRDLASNCRFGHPKNNHTLMVYARNYFASKTRRHSQIHLQQGGETGGDGDEEQGGGGGNNNHNDDGSLSELGSMTSDDPKHKKKHHGQSHNKHHHTKLKEGGHQDSESQSHQSGMSSANNNRNNEGATVVSTTGGNRPRLNTDKSETGFEMYAEFIEGHQEEEEVKEDLTEYMDWTCVVCKKENHLPRHPIIESDIVFGTKGVYYKRTYAVIQPRKDMPSCSKCMTYADYQPPGSSAHTFPHNPQPHAVFETYPRETTVAPGLKIDEHSLRYERINSFFFGLRNSVYSTPVLNDWRLRKYVMDKYPEIPRQTLPAGEFYELGEIVECKQQKFDWVRARITGVKKNHSYDIRYDGGDELRFVLEGGIRLRPEKGAYAYRVEMCMVLAAVLLPLGLLVACLGNPAILFLGPLLFSLILLCIRVVVFIQYFHNYYNAGMCTILRTSGLFALPLLLLLVASAVASGTALRSSGWVAVAVIFILAKVSSLPVLYMIRPPYALMGMVIFLQTSIGFYVLAMHVSGGMPPGSYIAIPLAPLITTTLCLKYVRRNLHSIWDVCLVIRPHRDTREDNPSILQKVKEDVEAYLFP